MGRPAIYGAAALPLLLIMVGAIAAGEAAFAVPIAILAVIVFGFFLFNDLLARRNVERHGGDVMAVQSDEDDSIPTAHGVADDATALGDTSEAHAEINPHDFPKDSAAREEAENQAAARGGATRGDAEGGGGERAEGASKAEGYAEGEQPSSDKAKSVGRS